MPDLSTTSLAGNETTRLSQLSQVRWHTVELQDNCQSRDLSWLFFSRGQQTDQKQCSVAAHGPFVGAETTVHRSAVVGSLVVELVPHPNGLVESAELQLLHPSVW